MSFSSLNTGLSALVAHRQAADVISHNIANVNTPGYTRQRAEIQAEGVAAGGAALFTRSNKTGTGARVEGFTRILNEFLEAQHRNESGIYSALQGKSAVLDRLEAAFPEPSDTGIAGQLNDFWSSWQTVADNPGSEAARTGVLEKGKLVIGSLQLADRQIRTQRTDARTNIGLEVAEVNQLSSQVAALNTGIRSAVVAGTQPNDLLDQRDQMVLRLAELTGATVQAGEHGMVDVFIGGRALVYGQSAQDLMAVDVPDPALGVLGLDKVQVQWKADGFPTAMSSGEIAGYVEGANDILPSYLTTLNTAAGQLVTSVNTLHTAGQDLDGGTGNNFFDPTKVTAGTISLSSDIAGQPRKLALAGAGAGALDNANAHALTQLSKATIGPDSTYRAMIVSLGSEVQFATNQTDAQGGVVRRLDEDRKSTSGVNLDEEMVNLVAAQHAYSAAARVITTVDEMLDTLINRTGVVGR
jgi:flagellar hook-associated protein 1 FlgK